MINKLEDLRQAKDEDVINIFKEIKEAGIKTSEFQEYFKTDYSYTTLRKEAERRGYVDGWHKLRFEKETITVSLVPNENQKRISGKVSTTTAEKWDEFTKGSTQKNILFEAALSSFMEAYKKNKVGVALTTNYIFDTKVMKTLFDNMQPNLFKVPTIPMVKHKKTNFVNDSEATTFED